MLFIGNVCVTVFLHYIGRRVRIILRKDLSYIILIVIIRGYMNQKIENLLEVSFQAEHEEVMKSPDLSSGYSEVDDTWEVIIRFQGNLAEITGKYNIAYARELLNQYAILRASKEAIEGIATELNVEFIEKPKQIYFELQASKSAACINQAQVMPYYLSGEGVIVAIIDTGINIFNREFRNEDGSTRILNIYDQTVSREYSRSEINDFLNENAVTGSLVTAPAADISGHGTDVAVIACGNSGTAPKSDIIVIKLGISMINSFPRTTQLMEAVDYAVKKGIEYSKPVAINISFGNNYGDHSGNSLFETFLNDISLSWKCSICIGSGNEANSRTHTSVILTDRSQISGEQIVELAVGEYETSFDVQIWKEYTDEFDVEIIAPDGSNFGRMTGYGVLARFRTNDVDIMIFYGEPAPYSARQEIYINFVPVNAYVTTGIWRLRFIPRTIRNGRVDLWLPASSSLNYSTGFTRPDSDYTFTVPSTSTRVITVGAYNAKTGSYSNFSGRGYEIKNAFFTSTKPDLVAPGENILISGMGITNSVSDRLVSGTSFATPFVTGGAALLMEWGIVRGNDAFLYGEKLKAYLIKGTRQLPGYESGANNTTGWGALCVAESIPD